MTEEKAASVSVKDPHFKLVDGLYIALMILPILCCILLKVLFTPASDGIQIAGAMIYLDIPAPLQNLLITESQINSWAVILSILGLCLYLTHGLTEKAVCKRQLAAEWIVEKCQHLVDENMGDYFSAWAPFIAAIMGLSAFSSLLCLVGLFSPTGDVNVIAGWAILVFIFIMHYKFKGGIGKYLIGLTQPIPIFAPMNVIGEFATPLSMAIRHYGNVLSGSVIATLVGSALGSLSKMLLGWLPGFLGDIPFLRIGLPAILSIYFDVFSGCMQAFIFAMLTMLNISGAVPWEDWEARKEKKRLRREKHLSGQSNAVA